MIRDSERADRVSADAARRPAPASAGRAPHPLARVLTEVIVAAMGAALLATALLANQAFLDRHFLPSFFITRPTYVLLETMARIGMGVVGLLLVLVVRPRLGRAIAHAPARVLQVTIAAALALAASEVVLRSVHLRPAEWRGRDQEPRRQAHPRLGWTFVPGRTGHGRIGGRVVDYSFDPAGYRVSRVDDPVNVDRPSLLFTGESVMFGKGLTWDESIPGQVGARLKMQAVNMAVDGYGTDQAYLRLEAELPRFRQPAAVVTLFMTTLFGRNLDDDRPHLGPGLEWLPAVHHGRLRSLLQLVAPYRSRDTIERGIVTTRAVLRATVDLATARGATPLILVPQFGTEDHVEAALRQRLLDEPGLPYLLVPIDPSWRVPGDVHPDALGAHVIATAVADRLAPNQPVKPTRD